MEKNHGGSHVKGKISMVMRWAAKFAKTQHFSSLAAHGVQHH
jgi:hypothetical protein